MCGRYYVDGDVSREIRRIVGEIEERLRRMAAGDVCPGQPAPAIMKGGRDMELAEEFFRWGFPGFSGSGLIVNARAETALEKRMFADSVENRRCVIPAKGFYEWNRAKEKAAFTRTDRDILYMAGFYRDDPEGRRFVILTTEANASMRQTHDRMPLILERDQVKDWIWDRQAAEKLLRQTPVELHREMEYEQQTLDLF